MKYEFTPSITRNESNPDAFNIIASFEIPQMNEDLSKFIDKAKEHPEEVDIFNELLNYMESDSSIIKNTENLYTHYEDDITIEKVADKYKKFMELYPDSAVVFANLLNFMIEAQKSIQREENASKILEWITSIKNIKTPISDDAKYNTSTENNIISDDDWEAEK
mgnify:FL=1